MCNNLIIINNLRQPVYLNWRYCVVVELWSRPQLNETKYILHQGRQFGNVYTKLTVYIFKKIFFLNKKEIKLILIYEIFQLVFHSITHFFSGLLWFIVYTCTRLYLSTLHIPEYLANFSAVFYTFYSGYQNNSDARLQAINNRHEKRAIRSINQFSNFLAPKVDISRKLAFKTNFRLKQCTIYPFFCNSVRSTHIYFFPDFTVYDLPISL